MVGFVVFAPRKSVILNHVGSKHMLLKEVAPAEVWASMPTAEVPHTPSAEASVEVSQETVGWTSRSGSTPVSRNIRDIFNLTSDEEC